MKSKTQSKRGRARFFFFFLLSLLILNFGVKGYWKLKSYSFQSYFKDVWEICHEKGFNEDYCILVDFSRPSGEDRMAIIDLNTLSVLDTGPCAHGKGKGNSAWKAIFSNKEGSRCSSLGAFKIAEKGWGCFTTSPAMLKKIEAICDKSKKPILLYAYK